MENITFDATEYTPRILLDKEESKIEFVGKSYPENTFEFYAPVLEWLKSFFSEQREVNVTLELEYLNSSSLKSFFDIFDIFEESSQKHNSSITVDWVYDEENDIALETGEDFQMDFEDLQINLVEKS